MFLQGILTCFLPREWVKKKRYEYNYRRKYKKIKKPANNGTALRDYDSTRLFMQYHLLDGFSDRHTIGLGIPESISRYHYNTVENLIISFLFGWLHDRETEKMRILDVGSGAGHWIGFYSSIMTKATVDATEITDQAVRLLLQKFPLAGEIVKSSISDEKFCRQRENKYDIVNAIGVMSHVVSDEHWEQAIKNISTVLKPGGLAIIGDWFGRKTVDVGYDTLAPDDTLSLAGDLVVTKRIRSLQEYRKVGERYRLRYIKVMYAAAPPESFVRLTNRTVPENNILVLVKG